MSSGSGRAGRARTLAGHGGLGHRVGAGDPDLLGVGAGDPDLLRLGGGDQRPELGDVDLDRVGLAFDDVGIGWLLGVGRRLAGRAVHDHGIHSGRGGGGQLTRTGMDGGGDPGAELELRPVSPHSTAKRPLSREPTHATPTMTAPTMISGRVHIELAKTSAPSSRRQTPTTHRRTRGRSNSPPSQSVTWCTRAGHGDSGDRDSGARSDSGAVDSGAGSDSGAVDSGAPGDSDRGNAGAGDAGASDAGADNSEPEGGDDGAGDAGGDSCGGVCTGCNRGSG